MTRNTATAAEMRKTEETKAEGGFRRSDKGNIYLKNLYSPPSHS